MLALSRDHGDFDLGSNCAVTHLAEVGKRKGSTMVQNSSSTAQNTLSKADADYLRKTRDNLAAAVKAGKTEADRRKMVLSQVTGIARSYRQTTESLVTRTVAAGIATHYAFETGAVADGRTKSTERGAGVLTSAEYAARFGLTSGAMVTRWRIIGRAVVVAGIDPTSDDLRGMDKVATREAVKSAVMADKPDAAKILAAVRTEREGKRQGPRKSAQSDKQADSAKGKGKGDQITLDDLTPLQAAHLAVKILDGAAKSLSLDEWREVAERLDVIVQRENLLHSRAATTPVVGKRTAKRVRKAQATTPAKQAEVA